ncbi:hypothetical protein J7436_20845, partial [Xanthomonas phaseoli pv. dieffenbachiae]|nr:hypothetical protein [Xanthomonas phaseoli pv. dieffenbachiae]
DDGTDLAVGEAGCLHGTSSEKGTRKFHFWRQLTCGGITPEVEQRAKQFIQDDELRAYFIKKAKDILAG